MRTAILAVMAAAMFIGQASAQDSGSFSSVYSYIRDYTSIEHPGGTLTAGSATGTSAVTASSGGPFVQGSIGIITCLVYARSSEDMVVSLDSPCLLTDGDGDKIYAAARREAGDIQAGGGGEGGVELIGGTGKYEGITGSCTYDTAYLPDNHIVTIADCTWER